MTTLGHSTVAGTTPYAWPWNGDLDPAGTATLVVGSVGSWPSTWLGDTGSTVATAVAELVAATRDAGARVIRVVTSPPAHSTEPDSTGDFAIGSDSTVTSVGIDGFFGSALDAHLRANGIERLLLVGAGLETAVHSTMRSANDRGFECLLVVDACFAYDDAVTPSSVSMIEMSGGIFGAVGTTAAAIEALAAAGRDQK